MIRKKLQDQLYVAFLKLVEAAIFGAMYAGALVGAGLLVGLLLHWDGLSLENFGAVPETAARLFVVVFAVITSLMWVAFLFGLGERR